ncbi:MAG: thiol oxidoreductase-like protein [Planctomycetes bacterium]|nr:thiol oxidoreductase-like protein [Planctomycetota bacterium]MBI3845262.1 thiol oxidoreductase-like protein [Planctomycetota bacterium]
MRNATRSFAVSFASTIVFASIGYRGAAFAQLIDMTKAPNVANEGIRKSLGEEIGPGRGDTSTPNSSSYLIARDPFRSVRRGRQLFQRKFTHAEGQGPTVGDGFGDVGSDLRIGAGLADSCAACHGRPRGSAGFGGDVATRPDSRDAPHLFGLGLKEMLADEMTSELRAIRAAAVSAARSSGSATTRSLVAKGIRFGSLTAHPDGSVDTTAVEGVDPDLRVRPFFAHGGTTSIREFVVGALQAEMGLQAVDPDLAAAHAGGRVVTPAGMVLDGSLDPVDAPPSADAAADPDHDGVANEVPTSLVDHFEFYLLNYFKPATPQVTNLTRRGRATFVRIGCAGCHVPDLTIDHDRRVADVETTVDLVRGGWNEMFATATPLFDSLDDGSGLPTLKRPRLQSFVVRNIFTDFKRHDLGPAFHERNYDGTMRTEFLTTPLWGVGTTAPYGHDGRSINLKEVIRRHGGEATDSRDAFVALGGERGALLAFLQSLVIFPPDDTASNLDPGDASTAGYPQFGHGSIKLTVLFNDPTDHE